MTRKNRKEKWQQLIEQMRTSGKSSRTWCTENGISYHTMRGWVSRLSKEKTVECKAESVSEIQWVEVRGDALKNTLLNMPPTIQVKIENFTVEIPEGFQSAMLVEICKALKTIC